MFVKKFLLMLGNSSRFHVFAPKGHALIARGDRREPLGKNTTIWMSPKGAFVSLHSTIAPLGLSDFGITDPGAPIGRPWLITHGPLGLIFRKFTTISSRNKHRYSADVPPTQSEAWHQRIFALLAIVTTLALAGCAVGPNYHAPQPVLPTTFVTPNTVPATAPASQPSTQPAVAVAPPVDITQWWTAFHDPILTKLVTDAMNANLDLKQAESRLLQARAARGVAAADFWPNVTGSGSYLRSRTPTGGDHGIVSNAYQVGLDAAWEIDIFGGVRRNIESSNASLQAAVEDRRDVLVTLTSEVALNYITLRGFQRELAVAQDNLAAQEHSADITRQKQRAGFVSSLDVANAEAQTASTRAQIPVLETGEEQTIFALSVLLGREPAALLAQLSVAGAIPPTPPLIPTGLPSDLLRRRPDIRRSEAQIHAATALIGVATADLFPKVSLTGSLGLESQQLLSITSAANRFWGFGPTVSWPVFDAGKIFSNIKVQDELTQQALLTYQKTVLIAMQDVDNALVAYGKEQEHRAALAQAVTANRKAVDVSKTLYANGQTDFLNVLTAQGSLFSSETALVQSEQNLDQDMVALYKALGGGWQDESARTQPTTAQADKQLN